MAAPKSPARRIASLQRRLTSAMNDAATLRDRFREIEDEAAELAECFDPDQNGIAEAVAAISGAVDVMSGPV
jgi:predicted  nucleic acid-binding Zn-ribbon protein